MEFLRDKRVGYGLVVALYLLVFPWHPGLNSPNELCRLWQSRALIEDGKLEINAQLQRYGRVGDLSVKEGRYYPSKAPLISFLAAPIYWVEQKFAGEGAVPPGITSRRPACCGYGYRHALSPSTTRPPCW